MAKSNHTRRWWSFLSNWRGDVSCSAPRRRTDRKRAYQLEQLEDRTVPVSTLFLNGMQTIVAQSELNAAIQANPASSGSFDQREVMTDVNPTNPLNVVAVAEEWNGLDFFDTEIRVYVSMDGGLTFPAANSTLITSAFDGLTGFFGTDNRNDPTVAFDASGTLYLAYAVDLGFGLGGGVTDLVMATSTDGGLTFNLIADQGFGPGIVDEANNVFDADTLIFFPDIDRFDPLPGIQRPKLATGPDGLGGLAAYVTYQTNFDVNPDPNTIEMFQAVSLAGTNDAGATIVFPPGFNDLNDNQITTRAGDANVVIPLRWFSDVAVGPAGEVYVVWHDHLTGDILFDRDIDGLFGTQAPFGTDIVVTELQTSLIGQAVPSHPNRGIRTAPSIDVDLSSKASRGTIYVSFIDVGPGGAPVNSNVFLASSSAFDRGLPGTWSRQDVEPLPGTEFNAWLDVDQNSAAISIVYYTSNGDLATGNNEVDVRVSATPNLFTPFTGGILTSVRSNAGARSTDTEFGDFGDYIGLAVHMGTIHAFWSDTRVNPPADIELFYSRAAFESSTNGNVVITTATPGNDAIELLLDPINPAYVDIRINFPLPPPVDYQGVLQSVDEIVIFGGDGDDALTVQFANGNPIPAVGLTYHAGAGANNTLTFADSSGAFPGFFNVIYEATLPPPGFPAHAGNIYLDAQRVSYTGLTGNSPSIIDFIPAVTRTFISSLPGGQVIRLIDAPDLMGIPLTAIDSAATNAFAPVWFRNPATALTINAGVGDDMIALVSVDPAFTADITALGGDGNDLIDATVFTAPAGVGVVLDGGAGNDTILDGQGNETLLGGDGDDSIVATNGDDSAQGGTGNDTIVGGVGNDTLEGGDGDDTLFGDAGNDSLLGGAGNDTIVGSDGDDTLDGGAGDDFLGGRAGNDIYRFFDGFDRDYIEEFFGEGIDTIDMSGVVDNVTFLIFDDAVAPDFAEDVGTFEVAHIERLIGGSNEDFFVFGPQGEGLAGGTGTIDGGPNIDTLDYSRFPEPVTVNLVTGVATGTGGIFNIENVIGTSGRPNNIVFLDGSVAPGGTATTSRHTMTGGSIFDPTLP